RTARAAAARREVAIRSTGRWGGWLVGGGRFVPAPRLRVYDRRGRFEAEVPLPADGTVSRSGDTGWFQSLGDPMIEACGEGFTFVHASFTSAPALHSYDIPKRTLTRLREPESVWPAIV